MTLITQGSGLKTQKGYAFLAVAEDEKWRIFSLETPLKGYITYTHS